MEFRKVESSSSPLTKLDCSVPRVRNKDELKQLEEKEDCFILDFDPNEDDDDLDVSKLTIESDLHVTATKGKVACRDYPHPRHACGKFVFRKTPHESHCELCYCYVCDIVAPCKKWVGKSKHCDAFDTEIWSIKRKLKREAVERKKEAYKDYPHPRYMCVQFPFEKTPCDKHCKMCCCYVCETNAPCDKWVGTFNHCLAINDENWRTKRELHRRECELRAKRNGCIARASMTTVQQENNPVHEERTQQQEQQTSQSNSVESSVDDEDDILSEETQVYVGNLSRTVDCDNLFELFMGAGDVEQAEVSMYDPRDVGCSRSLGYGLVTMGTVEEAENAVRMFHGSYFRGNVLTVKRNKGAPNQTYSIYVGNLAHWTGRKSLEAFFSKHGHKVVRSRIVFDEGHTSRGFGFVLMNTECERLEAIRTLNGRELDGEKVRLGIAAY